MKQLIVLFTLLASTNSINLQCEYHSGYESNIGQFYDCLVTNDLKITEKNTEITSVSGEHENGKTNDDVNRVIIQDKTVNYFPHGIDKIFSNIEGITILNSSLLEVYQVDFQPFDKLRVLELLRNKIEILEENLFSNNQKLEWIDFYENNLREIDATVFDGLDNLKTLILDGSNLCISKVAIKNREKVKALVEEVKNSCAKK